MAIMTLAYGVTYSDKVRPICLPSGYNKLGWPSNYDNEDALAAGFGLKEVNETWNRPHKNDNSSGVSPHLFKTMMKILPTDECDREFFKEDDAAKSAKVLLEDWQMAKAFTAQEWIGMILVVLHPTITKVEQF